MDARVRFARLSIGLLLAAWMVAGAGRAHAAAIGAHIGIDRAGNRDGDTPPNVSYSDQFGIVAVVQGEIALRTISR
jgi:hypothetical protein